MLLAGCASRPAHTPPPAQTITEPELQGTSPLNWSSSSATNPAAPAPPRQVSRPAPPVNRAAIATIPQPPPAVPLTTWISLGRWAAAHHLPPPRRVSVSPVAEYSIASKNGVMLLEIGGREATWNGVIFNLGFAPEIIDGEICLYGLDLQKNLEPLLCDPPLSFGANRVIVIDPGHGGSNVGTHSILDGRFEKEFTLDTALRLKPLLEAEGWTVFLTRTNDSYVTNSTRAPFATAHHAALFISLHFNSAAPDRKQAGLETYCFTPTGMPSTLTRGYSDPWTDKSSSNDIDAQNLQLALKMQTALLRGTGMEDRGVRHVRYIEVLRNQTCPAILIENGYLSNPSEARLIETPAYRQELAQTIAAALKPSQDGR